MAFTGPSAIFDTWFKTGGAFLVKCRNYGSWHLHNDLRIQLVSQINLSFLNGVLSCIRSGQKEM